MLSIFISKKPFGATLFLRGVIQIFLEEAVSILNSQIEGFLLTKSQFPYKIPNFHPCHYPITLLLTSSPTILNVQLIFSLRRGDLICRCCPSVGRSCDAIFIINLSIRRMIFCSIVLSKGEIKILILQGGRALPLSFRQLRSWLYLI